MYKGRWDWRRFVEQNHIHYVTQGRNVSAGHIAIKCPFCGAADPSEHMVLSLTETKPYWSCWRSTLHRGLHPAVLVGKLLGISRAAALNVVGDPDTQIIYESDWQQALDRIKGWGKEKPTKKRASITEIEMPRGVWPLPDGIKADLFLDYLRDRKFPNPKAVSREFDLHYAITGRFAYRLVFPIYYQGKLVNLVGRDITNRQKLRYLALGKDEAGVPLDDLVYNFDAMVCGGEILWLTEGPFDALKMQAYLPTDQVAVAFFGMPKARQLTLLRQHSSKFDLSLIALDAGTISASMRLRQELTGAAGYVWLSAKEKDLGNASASRVRELALHQRKALTTVRQELSL